MKRTTKRGKKLSAAIAGHYKPKDKPKRIVRNPPKRSKRPRLSVRGLKLKVWTALGAYVRLRDGNRCVTCGSWKTVSLHAGHYRHNSEKTQQLKGNALWFDLRNIHCQCFRCNRLMSGALDKYALYLEDTYGHGILQELNALFVLEKLWTREELMTLEFQLLCMADDLRKKKTPV